ncbi:PEP-CTERM sorting domain-containing protein [Tundrisphaera sp. TA3]|uniref:PEP-CTERM sorting domain-containing protein n=1 Tax=Tundrisphaera sp. TA3 TaxID=3435775 RepID=UPI003EBFB01D
MVRCSNIRLALAALALLGAGTTASAEAIKFATGDVEKDMPANSKSVTVVPGRAYDSVARPANFDGVDGFTMKDLRLSYDAKTDTLSVGINYYGIAGDVDGKGGATPGLYNPPNIGGGKSISVAFAPVSATGTGAGTPVVIAGIPVDKSNPILNANGQPATINGFKVATYNPNGVGALGAKFGTNLVANTGDLAFNPSAEHPDFEFTIKNFSKIPGLKALEKGFYVEAYTGTGTVITIGKSTIPSTFITPPPNQPQTIVVPPITPYVPVLPPQVPEPATLLGWGIMIGGAAWRVRRRIRPVASV